MTAQRRSLRTSADASFIHPYVPPPVVLPDNEDEWAAERFLREVALRKKNRLAIAEFKWQKEGF